MDDISTKYTLISIVADVAVSMVKVGRLGQEILGANDAGGRNAAIVNLGRTVKSLIIERDSRKAGLQKLQCSIEKFRMKLAVVYGSGSWHLTSLLRRLVRLFTRADGSAVSTEVETSRPSKFRILLVSHYCPTRAHAGGLRILDIYALIRQQCPSVQIDLLTFHRPSIDWSLDDVHKIFHNVYLSLTEKLTPEGLLALRRSPLHYDVIDLQFHQSGYQIDAFKRIGSKIIFTPMESQAKVALINLRTALMAPNGSRLLKVAASLRPAAEEIIFALKADEVVCVSQSDASFLRALTSSRRVRGVDTGVSQFEFSAALSPYFVRTGAAHKRPNILYVAYFGSETNVSALRWYLDSVHSIVKARVPGYLLTVVGRGDLSVFSGYRDDSIEFVGEVAVLAPSIHEARVGIAPALAGSGFRGKINQYAILGVPCVVSPIAHKGMVYQDGESIFVAERPEMFADRCIKLLTDFELNDRVGHAARELCLANYSWQSKWSTIRKIYNLAEEGALA